MIEWYFTPVLKPMQCEKRVATGRQNVRFFYKKAVRFTIPKSKFNCFENVLANVVMDAVHCRVVHNTAGRLNIVEGVASLQIYKSS